MTMGRRRKHRRDLPERVYFRNGSYFFVRKDGKWLNLGKNYVRAITRYAAINDVGTLDTMGVAMDSFIAQEIPKKAERTKREYLQQIKRLRTVFGHMRPDDIEPKDVYGYMDKRPAIAANREKSLLSALFSFAIRKGLCSDNPCRLVKRNTEKPRDRYVHDTEFSAVYKLAPAPVKCAMEIARLTGLRLGDILRLRLQDVKNDGLYVQTRKTGKMLIFELTPELSAVIAQAKTLGPKKVRGFSLIVNRSGARYTLDGFSTAWQKLMAKAMKDKVLEQRFTFHDLRAKAGSESENAQDLLGHDDPRTTNRVYRRLPRRVKPVSGKNIRQKVEILDSTK